MSERFSKLFACQSDLGVEDTPVLIKAGALLLDNQTKKIIAQFKLQNMSERQISFVKITITPRDAIQRELGGTRTHEYLDLKCGFQEEFGTKTPIYLSNPATRSFSVGVTEVVFDDGSIWTNDSTAWEPLSPESMTVKRFEAKTVYRKVMSLKATDTISNIEKAIEALHSIAELEDVEEEIASCQSRISELQEKEKAEEEERKKAAAKNKKIAAIIVASAVGVLVIVLLLTLWIIPSIKCNRAMKLIDQGKDQDAIEILMNISPFGESENLITAIQNRALERAEELYLQGECTAALEVLENVYYYEDERHMYYSISQGDYSSVVNDYSMTHLVIPNGTTHVGYQALQYCETLKSIQIPDSVTLIQTEAFSGCTSLESIVIPSGVTSIGSGAFENCKSLKSIVIPSDVTGIGYGAFENCESLESITISSGVTSIAGSVFCNCTSLQSITIPSGVTSINYSAFKNCTSLKNITIPSGVTSIGSSAFENCKAFTKIVIPDSVTTIDSDAFDGCDNVTLFCEAMTRPYIWSNHWNPDNRPVVWGSVGETFTYTFVTNGGSTIEDIVSFEKITLPTPQKAGMYFDGWYDNPSLTGDPVSSPYFSKTNHTLYAKWMTQEEYLAYHDGSTREKAKPLTIGETLTGTLPSYSSTVYYMFTPTETRSYTIEARDTSSDYYGGDKIQIGIVGNTTGYYGTAPSYSYAMTAGTTYYITIEPYSYRATGDFTISIS